eukprot:gene947-677_t
MADLSKMEVKFMSAEESRQYVESSLNGGPSAPPGFVRIGNIYDLPGMQGKGGKEKGKIIAQLVKAKGKGKGKGLAGFARNFSPPKCRVCPEEPFSPESSTSSSIPNVSDVLVFLRNICLCLVGYDKNGLYGGDVIRSIAVVVANLFMLWLTIKWWNFLWSMAGHAKEQYLMSDAQRVAVNFARDMETAVHSFNES